MTSTTAPATTQPPPTRLILSKVKQSGSEVTRKIVELLVGALTLVTALTWKDAVKSLFDQGGIFFVVGKWGPWANALFITVAVYFVTMWFQKWIVNPPPACTTLCPQPTTPPPQTTMPPSTTPQPLPMNDEGDWLL